MAAAYLAIKLFHILSAIIGIGFVSTFGVIMAGAAGDPVATGVSLKTLARLEKVAGPCFGVLIATGLLLGYLEPLGFSQIWFYASLGLAVCQALAANLIARPTLHRQLALIEQKPPPIAELQRLGARSRKTGMVLSFGALIITILMVFKPTL